MADLKINVHENVKVKAVLRARSATKEKVKNRNKPAKEGKLYADDKRSQIITLERTEEKTDIYHEGTMWKNGKLIIHPKHLKHTKWQKKKKR